MFETIYLALHLIIFPAWALLLFAPRWTWTQRLVHTAFIPLLLGAVYLGFLSAGVFFGQASEGAGFFTLAGVMALFAHPVGALTGWTHYLVFDLFIGAWIARDAARRDVPWWLMAPSLFFTLMFGPIGLAIYLTGRKLTGRGGWGLAED